MDTVMGVPGWGESYENYEAIYSDVARRFGVADVTLPWIPLVGKDARVLDLGCAIGRQARQLVALGCSVVGVEADARAAVRAASWCERVVVCDLDLVDLPQQLDSERFDVVAAGDILEHLRDPARLLQSLHQVLVPEGRVVASIPNVAHGSVRLSLLSGAFQYADSGVLDRTHLRFFTLATIQELFQSSGFAIDQLERIVVPIDQATPYDRSALPSGVEEAVALMPEATTFEYLVVARPLNPVPIQQEPASPKSTADGADRLLVAYSDTLKELEETNLALRAEVLKVEQQLSRVEGSRVWRSWTRLQSHRIVGPALRGARKAINRLSASRRRSNRSR
jgi:2-polyprenyl-3-methyl-5-hydroxy-6-metoxy-1,4-benzoquinol methylase